MSSFSERTVLRLRFLICDRTCCYCKLSLILNAGIRLATFDMISFDMKQKYACYIVKMA